MAFCATEIDLRMNCGDEYPTAGTSTIAYAVPVDAIDESGVTISTTKHSFTALAVDTLNWSPIEFKIDTGALSDENAKDGGGDLHTYSFEAFLNANTPEKLFLLNQLVKSRLVLIIPTNLRDATTKNRLAKVIGYDSIKGKGAGAMILVNDTIEAESGGRNGLAVTVTSPMGEISRFADIQITYEDGATGTTVNFGSNSAT